MTWVICISCHHHVNLKPLPRAAKPVCTACGSKVVRTTRVLKSSMLNGGQMSAELARQLIHAGLVSIARQRGYKLPGWATAKYRAIFDQWPPRQLPEPQDPNGELLWWIKKGNTAYAKARRAEEARPVVAEKPSALMTDEDWEAGL